MRQWVILSAALTAVMIVLRFMLRGKISLRLQYALWLLLLVRLLVPFNFGPSEWSVMNAVPASDVLTSTGDIVTPTAEPVISPGSDAPQPSSEVRPERSADVMPAARERDWARLTRLVWLTGAAAVGLMFLAVNLHFGRTLRRSRRRMDVGGGSLTVYESSVPETPCLFGIPKPCIYVTPETCSDADVLRYALAHEKTHFRHGDHVWAVLRGICLALHWYDPLVWWAAELSRRDAELACDEATVLRLGESERSAYGHALIRMTSARRPAPFAAATMMTDGKKGLRERIKLLAGKPKTLISAAAAAVLILCLASVGTFTGGRASLTDPFNKVYLPEYVYQDRTWVYTSLEYDIRLERDENDRQVIHLLLPDTEISDNHAVLADEVSLTRKNFDDMFRSDKTSWSSDSLSAAKLRRMNAHAWHGKLAAPTNYPKEFYLLQQKDGTLYLAMAYDQETIDLFSGSKPFFRFVFRLTEKAASENVTPEPIEEFTLISAHCTVDPYLPYIVVSFENTTQESIWTSVYSGILLQTKKADKWITLEKKHEIPRLMSEEEYPEVKAGENKVLSVTLDEYELERDGTEYRICLPIYSQVWGLRGYLCAAFEYGEGNSQVQEAAEALNLSSEKIQFIGEEYPESVNTGRIEYCIEAETGEIYENANSWT